MMKLILCLLLTVGGGSLVGLATAGESSGEWFLQLNKPAYQPPNWLFGPVWTTLYILMGIALFLVWKKPASSARNAAITLFMVQLAFNFLWSFLFFKWHMPGAAFADIIALWITLFITIVVCSRHSKTAAWLLVPYIAWVSFASILNFDIIRLN